ncbi:ABC transporter permease [Clostridium gasigenes]|uniref:ABC transporter permease n=1 Tax=Clostridium gasigenes TaxID=94869 RepID=UPI0016242896|nr:ABC transporter permease [Clostridium gasigenes]MBB6622101.1 ABC transporter permease [Clostridium gasigenes]MBU3086940.1 ABC transporter permease [Clostridium gasigenes]MBU3102635.1 ABC transporter permease [Clostridium gasigenes]MBU3131246.1 ABC transporter permease [Clostridium gasigenes]QSW18496.1 ABC transporter permease [Clostridium gasigenes]
MKKKILMLCLTVIFAVIATFFIIELMPGDPVDVLAREMVSTQGVPYEEAYKRAVMQLNYDPNIPLTERILDFGQGIIKGELGQSLKFKTDVKDIVISALPWTLLVTGISTILAFTVGISIGMFTAWKRSKKLNLLLDTSASVLGAIPEYIVGFFLILIFAVNLKMLPSKGAYSTMVDIGFNMGFVVDVAKHAILPILAFFIVSVVNWIVNMRATAVGILGEDYIQYARARGISKRKIVFKYVGRNAMLPMITSLASTFGLLVGGSPLIENLFSYPGVGYYLNNATANRDITLMQGMFFVIIITVILCNFLVELLYGFVDPRLRRKGRS